MDTARIRIESQPSGGYSVLLFLDAEADAVTSSEIPADLATPAKPAVLGDGPAIDTVPAFVRENPDSDSFGAIGEYLASVLFSGTVGERWMALRRENPGGFRTLLEIEPEDLRLIPWELTALDEQRLFIDPDFAILRTQGIEPDATQELVPLRLLVVEGERDETINTLAEIHGIKAALPGFFGRIDAEFLLEPNKQDFLDAVARIRPHIFHFVGHGVQDPTTGQPALKVRNWLLRRQDVLELVKPIPRVAVMNACRSGDVVGVRALTEAFLSRGAAAVIGMQGDVRGQAAARFATALYRALARGEPIDRAVASARMTVYGTSDASSHERDWALPSLSLRVHPDQVLPMRCGISDAERQRVEQRLFSDVALFVDRTKQRWELASAVDPDVGPWQPVLRVVGAAHTGKTWLVQWIRTRCALRGRRVRYVDFKGLNNDFVTALCAIRDTEEDVPSLVPAGAQAAFDRFSYDLSFLMNGQVPPEPSGELVPMELPQELKLGRDSDTRIFTSFRAALGVATSEEQPLVLILDHLGGVQKAHFQNWLYPYLVRRLIDGDVPGVRLIVVMSQEQQTEYWPAEEIKLAKQVVLDLNPPDEFVPFAEDYLLAGGVEIGTDASNLINAMKAFQASESWSLMKLKPLDGISFPQAT